MTVVAPFDRFGPRRTRGLLRWLAGATVLGLAAPAGSVVTTSCCWFNARDVLLRVGTATAGTVDVVRFDVGGPATGNALPAAPNPHGSGAPVSPSTGSVPIYLRVRVPFFSSVPNIRVTVTSPANLTCASGCGAATIPFSQISWTVGAPGASDFQGGTLGGAPVTILGPTTIGGGFLGTEYEVTNTLDFSFANSAAFTPGRYTGSVTYTVALP